MLAQSGRESGVTSEVGKRRVVSGRSRAAGSERPSVRRSNGAFEAEHPRQSLRPTFA